MECFIPTAEEKVAMAAAVSKLYFELEIATQIVIGFLAVML